MKRVMIRCPETGRAVFTGIQLPQTNLHREHLPERKAVGCPHCGDLHDWTEDDMWFERVRGVRPEQHDGAVGK